MTTREQGPHLHVSGVGRKVTMKDVAEVAGVSTATVSQVINRKKESRVGEATKQRVFEAVKALGYRQNLMAKGLVEGRSHFLGIVADSIATTPFAGQIIKGAQEEAWRHGRVLLVANTEGDAEAETDAIRMMLEHNVGGIVYATWYHRETRVPQALSDINHVLVNCFDPTSTSRCVVPNEAEGGYRATSVLLEAGHTKIAFINTTTSSPARVGRLEGYTKALADHGIDFDPALVLDSRPDQEGGYDAFERVHAMEVTGVFCHNDRVAMGLYDAARERGLRIPGDLSVVGFDDQEVIAGHVRPPLTTVALPHYAMGVAGVRALVEPGAMPAQVHHVECPPVIRGSVQRARGD